MADIKVDHSAANDIAGRDIIKKVYSGSASPLAALLTTLADGEDKETRGFIDKLKHFISDSENDSGKVIGLKTKLTNGGAKPYYILYATEVKEDFSKLLEKNSTNLHTQEVYAHLMCSIRTKFMHHVRQHLEQGTCDEVLEILHEKVIVPTLKLVAPNPLQINEETISGMLFFLTGNCHLEWGDAGI